MWYFLNPAILRWLRYEARVEINYGWFWQEDLAD